MTLLAVIVNEEATAAHPFVCSWKLLPSALLFFLFLLPPILFSIFTNSVRYARVSATFLTAVKTSADRCKYVFFSCFFAHSLRTTQISRRLRNFSSHADKAIRRSGVPLSWKRTGDLPSLIWQNGITVTLMIGWPGDGSQSEGLVPVSKSVLTF